MTECIFPVTASILWYIEFIGSESLPPERIFSPYHRLTQVASLASRHEQFTVCAAFFCPKPSVNTAIREANHPSNRDYSLTPQH